LGGVIAKYDTLMANLDVQISASASVGGSKPVIIDRKEFEGLRSAPQVLTDLTAVARPPAGREG
jgi:hypothetical protein